ncbi:MAG TPA: exonuclease SbcCD subunit D [Segeticoccus sp.]|jgi:exonuclease SbcD|nr:exonuclease SbcCD subunit D [Segeticoccus sp.]
MRLLHTSDWHLGRSFHRVGLLEAQAAYADHLVEVVRSERVDAVLVSGDVYDRALPAPDTVALLSETVRRLVDAGTQVVLSSGNHDSAIRLGFASELLERAGLHIRTRTDTVGTPVLLEGVAVYPLPYLEPAAVADGLGATERTHAGVLRAAMQRVDTDRTQRPGPSVVMAHAFVTGGASSESERDIGVGGVSAVPPEVFGDVDYVALGHLHGPQRIAEAVRYSGSPVALSFSEADHPKGSCLVDVQPGTGDRPARVEVEHVPAPVYKPLARLRGTLEELLSDGAHAAAESAWVEATLTDAQRPRGAMERLRNRFPGCLSLQFDGPTRLDSARSYAARLRHRSDLDVCCDFLEHVRSVANASDAERRLLATAVEESARERGRREGEGQAVGARGQGVA